MALPLPYSQGFSPNGIFGGLLSETNGLMPPGYQGAPNPAMAMNQGIQPMARPNPPAAKPPVSANPGFMARHGLDKISPAMWGQIGLGIGTGNYHQGMAGASKMRQANQQQEQTQQQRMQILDSALENGMINKSDHALFSSNPLAAQLGMKRLEQRYGQGAKLPAAYQNYKLAQQDSGFAEHLQKTGSGETFGKSPVWGTDENGKRVLGVVGDQGNFKTLDTPGFNPQQRIQKTDIGTEVIFTDSYTGEIIKRVPKSLLDAEKQKAIGKKQGEASQQLAGAHINLAANLELVDELLEHEDFEKSLGPIEGRLPSWVKGTEDFRARVEQLRGTAFMSARAELKGAGQVTDFEGQRAENALVRMEEAVTEKQFKQALSDFKEALIKGYRILESKAGKSGQITPPNASETTFTPAQIEAEMRRRKFK